MLLVIDNYDSFTYNLVQYLGEMGEAPEVRRNDQVTVPEIEAMHPKAVVISPGPGTPADAGIKPKPTPVVSARATAATTATAFSLASIIIRMTPSES